MEEAPKTEIDSFGPEVSPESDSVEKKVGSRLDLILLLILGILLGVVIKTEAVKRITIGKDDYKLGSLENSYNINQIQKELGEKQAKEEEAVRSQSASQGEASAVPSNNQEVQQ